MRKKTSLIIFAGIFLFLILGFVSSAEWCCKKTKDEGICQEVEQSRCKEGYVQGVLCPQLPDCIKGTCVDSQTGECKSQSYYWKCIEDGGQWYAESANQLPECQNGCCYLGQNAFPATAVECKQLAYDHGIETKFDSTITDEDVCIESSGLDPEGACIYKDSFGLQTCSREIKSVCKQRSSYIDFEAGKLCTSPDINLCSKTEKTMLHDDYRVYFVDSCGNRANIYDYPKRDEDSYWITIIQPQESCGYGEELLGVFAESCGNCNPIYNTIGKNKNDASFKSNSRNYDPKIGDYACADMGCVYDTDGDGENEYTINNDGTPEGVEYYKHGESWCAMAPGNYFVNSSSDELDYFHGILINGTTKEYVYPDEILKALNLDYEKYNTPGTEYYVLNCVDGEVIESNCGTLRTEICVEYWEEEADNFRYASCATNTYRDCIGRQNIDACENTTGQIQMCKWVEGFRWDDQNTHTNKKINWETQGSCVPLFPPGFMFWTDDSNDPDGNDLNGIETCGAASESGATTYQLSWIYKRDNFADNDICKTSGSDKNLDLVQRCTSNCFWIPSYGSRDQNNLGEYLFNPYPLFPQSIYAGIYNSALFRVHKGYNDVNSGASPSNMGDKLENYCVSDRKDYYCTGSYNTEVGGESPNCAADSDTRRTFPVYFTHGTFLDSIMEKTKSLGDCGYKESAFSVTGNPSSELMKVYFQKLDNNGNPKGEPSDPEIIYKGDEFVGWRQN